MWPSGMLISLFFFFFGLKCCFVGEDAVLCMRVVFWIPARSVVKYEIMGLRDEWVEAYPQ